MSDNHSINPLRDAQSLCARIEGLKALLELQRRQVEAWETRLYGNAPAGTAARRLVALKQAGGR
jgi:hypothetical protein